MKRPKWFKTWLYGYIYKARQPWWKRAIVWLYIRIALRHQDLSIHDAELHIARNRRLLP